MPTLFTQFEKTVHKIPEKKAVCFFENNQLKSWSYKELYDKAVALSEGLLSLGLRKGDRVAILSPNRPEWPVLDLAVARAGMVLVTIHTSLSGGQIHQIVRQSSAKVLALGTDSVIESFYSLQKLLPGLESSILEAIKKQLPNIKNLILLDQKNSVFAEKKITYYLSELIEKGERKLQTKKNAQPPHVNPSDLSTIMYTSGTTGKMKGVMLSHQNVRENAMRFGKVFAASPQDIYFSILPLSHAFERSGGLYLQLFYGIPVCYGRGLPNLLEDLRQIKPTWMCVVPRLAEKLCQSICDGIEMKSPILSKLFQFELKRNRLYQKLSEEKSALAYLFFLQNHIADRIFYKKIREKLGGRFTRFICGGAPLDPELGYFFKSIGIRILEGYGTTESSPGITANPYKKEKFGSVGLPLSKVKVRIGKNDEILTKGHNVMLGYDGDPQETRRVIDKQGWLHTGDQGYFDEDGYLHIKGRIKEMLVTGYGENIYPTAVERELEKSPYIKQTMVCGDNRPYLAALIVPERDKLLKFAESNGIKNLPYLQLLKNKVINLLIQNEIENYSKPLAKYEQVKKFSLLDQEFTEQNNCLTPTLKLKRPIIVEKYRKEIESLYKKS